MCLELCKGYSFLRKPITEILQHVKTYLLSWYSFSLKFCILVDIFGEASANENQISTGVVSESKAGSPVEDDKMVVCDVGC